MVTFLLVLWLATVAGGSAAAVDAQDTRLLAQPAVSKASVAFAYDNDLWITSRSGGPARRLTSHEGRESNPRFSPDGDWVAFSGEYDGNTDVYVIAVAGGAPRRLTWHPGADIVQGFTPDGSAVLFFSGRSVHTNRYVQLFTVPLTGGFPSRLPIPNGLRASYNADGSKIAYIPISERNTQWKNYRGGTTSRIWLYDTSDHSVVEVPQPTGRSNDTDPMWVGDSVYFRSDRDGEINLHVFSPATGEVRRLTSYEDFPVLAASAESPAAGSQIVYEQAGYIHLFDTARESSTRLQVAVPADLKDTRPRLASDRSFIRSVALSPSGARAVLGYRGEVVTLPAKKGAARHLTGSPGAHERSPVWSNDGSRIAFFSDRSGEYELHLVSQDGRGEVRTYALDGAGFYEDPRFSPDDRYLSYIDNSWSLYVLDLVTGSTTKVGSEPHFGPRRAGDLHHAWSPDSRWLVYTMHTPSYIQTVFLYSIEENRSYAVTDGLSEASEPVFDASGKYLYFFASTDAGPVKQWFAMSNADMELSRSLYLAVLRKGEASPLAPESDEEEGSEDDGDEAGEEGAADEVARVEVDFEGLEERIVAVPIEEASYSNLRAGAAGRIYYLRASARGEAGSLRRYDLDERDEKTLISKDARSFSLAPDGSRLLYRVGDKWGIADSSEPIDLAETSLDVDRVEVRIDPRVEWEQIFDEAWRVNRDYFYDPGMHGADWPAMKEKYSVFLPDLATRQDLNRVLQWMCSEIAVGHHSVFGGDLRTEVESVPGGLLGADLEVVGDRYRFARVLGGLNWNPELRPPLTEPGVGVAAGEYLIAVEGRDLRADENVYSRFEKTADRNVEITVAASADGSGARTVTVVPVRSEGALRNRAWVEGNLRRVDEATDGRVAYVYVPNTSNAGHTYFKRYFFPQAHKDAIIVDERFNGGGQVADYYIDHLRRPYISHWATRYGADIETPGGAIQGPKVMLIDETAGSGGDLLPWMFTKLGLGTLVGKRTWGGLVGVLGFPVLMDGGGVTAPNLAIWTEDGFVVENVGVPPDVEVEQWPAEVIAGRDPQLEKAIEIALEQLEAAPPPQRARPPFPVRVRR
jgi:tricorn protease